MSKKCLDDELYDIYIQDGKQVIESLREIYNKGMEDAEPKWIPCSERLPEKRQYVLAQDSKGFMCVTYHDGKKFWFFQEEIVAWMQLPKPYEKLKEQKNENI